LYSGAKRRRDGHLVASRSFCGNIGAPTKYLTTGCEHMVGSEGVMNK
jgi:hypothetical protein